ncbi:MAG TPA: tetraacyldisaccharide 4'-kinase [Terriglobales bacterium]|nr:tetraacyldisaccharide 4'-kinase [Terriglobales bacterium]
MRSRLLWLSLLPLSAVYRVFVQIRNFLFAWGWLKSQRLTRPVVSVGNLTVGGTGKTPTCIWLAQELSKRGLKVGILSRGYKRQEVKTVVVKPQPAASLPADSNDALLKAGDEPFMMAQLYGQTVAVGPNRSDAAALLLRQQDVDMFILDDGFQHRRIQRDFDLLLLGNDATGCVLPAGPFREPRRSLRRADGLLVTGAKERWQSLVNGGGSYSAFAGSLRPVGLIGFASNRWKEFPLTLLYRSKIVTVTGIADPRGVYEIIHEWEGELVETLEFPDHHVYTARDWQQINRVARLVDLIVTTEKDILKLIRFPFAKDKLLALRVAMSVENGESLIGAIVEKVERARAGVR